MTMHEESSILARTPEVNAWRAKLSPLQKNIIQQAWIIYLETGNWAPLRPFYRQHMKSVVIQELSALAGFLTEDEDHQSGNRLKFQLPGIFLTKEAPRYLFLINRYYQFQFELFQREEGIREIKSDEIGSKLLLEKADLRILGLLLQLGHSVNGYANNLSTWTVRSMTEVENFAPSSDFLTYVEAWILKNFYPENPVFAEARMQKQVSNALPSTLDWSTIYKEPIASPASPVDVNPFQRRYQVFVSSTFSDLIEERKHVMQALLVTKCIPAGMELFPAASMEQMNLIQGVIDDSDYYLIILSGRYGSCANNGKGYTEMEFDYAVSKGKPILAFYYSDIRKLPGERLEETDEGRKKLALFRRKVMNQRLCHEWNTPDGLASAIKTSIIHAIETNPKPGWVRADSVPTWNMVRNLETRIADLEDRPHFPKADNFPTGNEEVSFNAHITWVDSLTPGNKYGKARKIEKQFSLSWNEIFLLVAEKLQDATTRRGLSRSFGTSLAKKAFPELQAQTTGEIRQMFGAVDVKQINKFIDTFTAQKLIKQTSKLRGIQRKAPCWQLTQKGLLKLSELRVMHQ